MVINQNTFHFVHKDPYFTVNNDVVGVNGNTISLWSTNLIVCIYQGTRIHSKNHFNSTVSKYVLQSITKKHIPQFFNLSFFMYISGTAWGTINLFSSFFTIFWRAFSWNKNVSHLVTKSADICKNVNLPIKSYLLGKIRHFEKVKNFFPWI